MDPTTHNTAHADEQVNEVTRRHEPNFFTTALLVLILLCAVSFYKIIWISEDIIYLIQAIVLGFMFVTLVFQIIYWKIPVIKHHFSVPVLLIFSGVFISMLMAYYAHKQGFEVSLWAQRFMYFYIFYFFLHIFKIPIYQIEKIIFIFGLAYAFAYLLQYFAFPTAIFDVRIDPSRSTIRIFIPGFSFMLLAFFFSLQELFYKNSLKHIIYLLLFFSILVLSGTRQVIANIALISFLALIFSKRIKSKLLIYFLAFLAAVAVYFLFHDIINSLLTISQEQTNDAQNEITRLKTTEFFLTDFFPNQLAYITGNGESHQWSAYGREVQSYKMQYGYYLSDIGFIGEYTKYGLFFAIGALMLLIRALKQKLPQNMLYIKLFFFSNIIALPVGAMFSQPYSIVAVCLLLYMIDRHIANTGRENYHNRPIVYFSELENVN